MSDEVRILHQTSNCNQYKVTTIVNGPFAQNSYVLVHLSSGEALVIDPGASINVIKGVLENQSAKIKHIILTHAHFDHVGSAADLVKHYNVDIHMHDGDKRLLRMAPIYALKYVKRVFETPKKYVSLGTKAITWAGDNVETILTPGHTEGGVCYRIGSICFTGDTVMQSTIGNTDLPGANFDQLRQSVSRLLDVLPYDVELYSGHGRPWPVSKAKAWWELTQHKNANEFDVMGVW